MTLGLIGKKVGMTTVFDQEGLSVPVTVIKLGQNIVTNKMTKETNGYTAVQIGGFPVKERKLNKPELGAFKKRELPLMKPLKEFRVADLAAFNIGEPIKLDSVVAEGILVDVQGNSIGKGFQGTIKRFNHGRGPMSHGSKFHRSMGSIGPGTTPGRVFKGIGMPGQMGNQTVTVRHLQVVRVDAEKGLVLVRGATPGVEGGLLIIKPSKTKWNP
jgi:large subunit ribosomal protein L3